MTAFIEALSGLGFSLAAILLTVFLLKLVPLLRRLLTVVEAHTLGRLPAWLTSITYEPKD